MHLASVIKMGMALKKMTNEETQEEEDKKDDESQ